MHNAQIRVHAAELSVHAAGLSVWLSVHDTAELSVLAECARRRAKRASGVIFVAE